MADNFFKAFWNRMNGAGRILFIMCCGYFIYIANKTKLVPNFNNETSTLLYAQGSVVPQSGFSAFEAALGIILIFITCYTLLMRSVDGTFVTRQQASRIVMDEFEKDKKDGRADERDVLLLDASAGGAILKTVQYGSENEIKPLWWCISGTITYHDGREEYVRYHVHAYSGFCYGYFISTTPLSGADLCPTCGKEFGVKYVSTPEISELKKFNEYIRPKRRD